MKRSVVACLGGAVAGLAIAFAPLALGRAEPLVPLVFGAVMPIGLALALLALGAVGPSLDHHRRTGRYLLPAKGGTFETRHAAVLWLVLGVFGGLGATLTGLALFGLVESSVVALGG